jgi:DNA (cytosine-5)-methyltransferase 1
MRVIDLFAGAGGFSTCAGMAGAQVVWAANHWRAAVVIHKHNHPDAIHVCQDLHQADWSQVPEHDVMLASHSCQGHSRARGKDRPHHDAARSTAWAVVDGDRMRMLQPYEYRDLMGFPKNYLLPGTRKEAIHMLGNAVCPPVARDIVQELRRAA